MGEMDFQVFHYRTYQARERKVPESLDFFWFLGLATGGRQAMRLVRSGAAGII